MYVYTIDAQRAVAGPSNTALVQIHPVPANTTGRMPAPKGRAPRPPTSGASAAALHAQAVNNSRTLAHNAGNNPNSSGGNMPCFNVPNPAATRTLPPPPPALREEPPSQPSSNSGGRQNLPPLPAKHGNNEPGRQRLPNNTNVQLPNPPVTGFNNTDTYNTNSDSYNTDTYQSDAYNTDTGPTPRAGVISQRSLPHNYPENVALLSGYRGGHGGVASPPPPSLASSGEREDDDSVKYYVLEGPTSSIRPTLNSDPENSL